MSVTAVVGANWGDEGKGKITDVLADSMDFVVRYQGGSNAGHTILNHWGKFALHLLPSGVFYPHVHNVLGPGVALNIPALADELAGLKARGVPAPTLSVSDRTQIVLPVHVLMDQLEEGRLKEAQFGSTRSGIAPFYADKALKIGIMTGDLFDQERLYRRVAQLLAPKNVLLVNLYGHDPLDPDETAEALWRQRELVSPFLTDTTALLQCALRENRRVLLEGQLGALRDPDHGIFPYTTSSSPLAGYAAVGAGIPPHQITRVIAVTKAYSSAVGNGPFTAELPEPEAHLLRQRGGDAGEYGATTGRPRRVGWFDAVATRYGASVQGATEIALTNLDVLGAWDVIPLVSRYRVGHRETDTFPPPPALDQAEPVFEELPGWRTDISGVTDYRKLPDNARRYVDRIEELIGTPIRILSVGPKRHQTIVRT